MSDHIQAVRRGEYMATGQYLLLLAGIWPAAIQAQSAQAGKTYSGLATGPLQSMHISNYLIGIVIVFVVLGMASWLLRRYQPRMGHGLIRVHSCLSLGGKERLMLVEVQGQRLLIGVCPNGVNLLRNLETDFEESPLELNDTAAPQAGNWLRQTLNSMVKP